MNLWEQRYDPIIQAAYIQKALVEFREEVHYILFNNIPATLIELDRDSIRPSRFIFLHLKKRSFNFVLRERHNEIRIFLLTNFFILTP